MKKIVKKHSRLKLANKNKKTKWWKLRYSKGALGAGTAYVILALLVIVSAGAMMIGSIIPTTKTPDSGQPVTLISPKLAPSQANLQLETFPGATLTPTPEPTVPPQPQESSENKGSSGDGEGHGTGGSSSCFPQGTKILMADRTQKNIEDVQVGDKVLGFNGVNQVPETVLELESPVRDHLYKLTFADGTKLELTREHPLYTSSGWKSISPESTAEENASLIVKQLVNGDEVLNSKGKYTKLISIEYIPGTVQTYNLKAVSGFNNFFANFYLAHNKGGGGGSGGGGYGGGGSAM